MLWQGSTEGLTVGVVANKRLAAQRRTFSRHIERSIREAERRSPQVAEIRARIRRAVRVGRAAVQSREQAQSRLADALRRLIGEGLSIREAAERVGVAFYDARSLVSGKVRRARCPRRGMDRRDRLWACPLPNMAP